MRWRGLGAIVPLAATSAAGPRVPALLWKSRSEASCFQPHRVAGASQLNYRYGENLGMQYEYRQYYE